MDGGESPVSHCDQILHALRDGEFHTTAALYREVGPCILHSRISDLRAKGHNVEGRHVPGKTGADGYQYRLLPSVTFVDVTPHRRPDDPTPLATGAEQLSILADNPLTQMQIEDGARAVFLISANNYDS